MEGSVAWVRPHPSISGGTARGAAPQGAGGTKSRTAPEKGFRRERSTDVNRCRSSGARGPCTARQRNSSVRSARRTPSVIRFFNADTTPTRGPALDRKSVVEEKEV